jgi:hypothetical protein
MITIRLWGGIGNQLFQYSFGEYLRLKTQQEVKYDIASFGRTDKLRKLELQIINPAISVIDDIKFSYHKGLYNRLLRYLFCLKQGNEFIDESHFTEISFLNNPAEGKGIKYFQGYWQSEIYPNEILKNNLDCFTPRIEKPFEIQRIEHEIKNEKHSTALHVRRGDYFASKKNIKRYGVCNQDYYHRAINYLYQKQKKCRIFVFSDDLKWVKDNIELPENVFFVSNYDINNFWFIYLMSQCKNNIISNSSFSWWGAYLNSNADKIVIAPVLWETGSTEMPVLSNCIKL